MDAEPAGYIEPVLVYLVEEAHPDNGEISQIGGFFDRPEAEKLRARLDSEGRPTRLNRVPIHRRWIDYEYDR